MSEREMDLDLERVVNSRSEKIDTADQWVQNFHTERYNNRRTRVAAKAIYSFFGAAGFFGLWAIDLLIGWVALPLFVFFACICSGSIGRLIEMNRK